MRVHYTNLHSKAGRLVLRWEWSNNSWLGVMLLLLLLLMVVVCKQVRDARLSGLLLLR
jgi:hypothetical protein